jgi:hypothetical protein
MPAEGRACKGVVRKTGCPVSSSAVPLWIRSLAFPKEVWGSTKRTASSMSGTVRSRQAERLESSSQPAVRAGPVKGSSQSRWMPTHSDRVVGVSAIDSWGRRPDMRRRTAGIGRFSRPAKPITSTSGTSGVPDGAWSGRRHARRHDAPGRSVLDALDDLPAAAAAPATAACALTAEPPRRAQKARGRGGTPRFASDNACKAGDRSRDGFGRRVRRPPIPGTVGTTGRGLPLGPVRGNPRRCLRRTVRGMVRPERQTPSNTRSPELGPPQGDRPLVVHHPSLHRASGASGLMRRST